MKWALACALALAASNTALAFTLPSGSHTSLGTAITVASVSPAPSAEGLDRYRPRRITAAPLTSWRVKPGQSLSFIAGQAYGSTALWPALWWINKASIRNPDIISSGQVIKLSRWHPGTAWLNHAAMQAIPAARPAHAAVAAVSAPRGRHAASGKIWGVTRGYPNLCGDGDGDGWDVNCQSRTARAYRPRHAAARFHAAARIAAVTGSSRYSYAGLEALWISAGGPAWAAAHAAEIAECESGGNVYAFNPSGATGLWQILGSVVAGSLTNPYTNALNAVSKFRASGDTFAQWVCK